MNQEFTLNTLDTPPHDPYGELKERFPHLFEPIPTRIGTSEKNPDGYPVGVVDGWRDIDSPDFNPVEESGEPLVNVANLVPPLFTTNDYGAKLHQSGYETTLVGATTAQYVRAGVAEKLIKAQQQLPENYRLVIFDAWRSLDTQYATYEMCYQSLIDKLVEEGVLSADEPINEATAAIISKETQKFISLPSPLPETMEQSESDRARAKQIPSPHNTGGSVDLGIVKIDEDQLVYLQELESIAASHADPLSKEKAFANFEIARLYRHYSQALDFGTSFDFAGSQSGVAFCETDDSLGPVARDSRRILYNAMTNAGFEAYAEEWWHFNSGNQMAAMTTLRRTGEAHVAKYGNTSLSDNQKDHERYHQAIFDYIESAQNPTIQEDGIPPIIKEAGGTKADLDRILQLLGDSKHSVGFEKSWDMKYRGELAPEFTAAVQQSQLENN